MTHPPLHESVRNKLMKQQRALVLGVADMAQAIAAARALKSETDETLARIYETALVVSFMRPFSGNSVYPRRTTRCRSAPDDAQLLADMKTLRDKVYAHTDRDTGRRTSSIAIDVEGELVTLRWNEAWVPLPRERLDPVIEVCEMLKEAMTVDAGKAQLILNGELPLDRWDPLSKSGRN